MSPKYVLTALTALTIAACTDAGQSMIILNNQVPGDGCSVEASETGSYLSRGRIHPDSSAGYLFTPVVKSLVVEREGLERRIFLEGADIELEDATGAEVAAFGAPISGNILPGGLSSLGFEIVPTAVMDTFGEGLLLARIQIYGDLAGGEVTSDVFTYPVEVCRECYEQNLGPCAGLEPGFVGAAAGSTCNPLQDGSIQCCEADDGTLTCPARGPAPA
jgi:hypothetical protein